jgi:hypothetical protein
MTPFFIENVSNNTLGEDESTDDEESTITNGHSVVQHRYFHQNDRDHHRHEPDFWLEDAPRYHADDWVTLPRSDCGSWRVVGGEMEVAKQAVKPIKQFIGT